MLPRERVIRVIRHGKPDRIPIYGWLFSNLSEQISAEFGSVEAFEDRYEFDFAHIFGGPRPYAGEVHDAFRKKEGRPLHPADLLDLPMNDPDDHEAYRGIVEKIRHHKEERGRFVYVQTPGIFEALNGPFGIENHLCHLVQFEEDLHRVYRRQAEWNRRFANNCIDLGVDMIHVSDDWGAQNGLLFNPTLWRRLIRPYHKSTCDAVKRRGAFLSLHSDGNIRPVLADVAELGFDVVHPYQESAGMDFGEYRNGYRGSFVLMGGLDVQTTIGFGKLDLLRAEIGRVMRTFADGGLLFCTTHFVQAHCTMEELKIAFDTAYALCREVCR